MRRNTRFRTASMTDDVVVVIAELDQRVCRGARRRRIRALLEAVESSGIVLANQAGRIYMRFMAFRLLVPSVPPVPRVPPPALLPLSLPIPFNVMRPIRSLRPYVSRSRIYADRVCLRSEFRDN